MFCNQCEETLAGGCTVAGVCGKSASVAALQDLVLSEMIAVSLWADAGRRLGIVDEEMDAYVARAVFHTVTNVDFDTESLEDVVRTLFGYRQRIASKVGEAGGKPAHDDRSLDFAPADTSEKLLEQATAAGHFSDRASDPDVRSLEQITIYGVKGISAYADHAEALGYTDPEVSAFIYEAFASLADRSLVVNDWVGIALKTGEANLKALALLDKANTETYGAPQPTQVPLGHRPRKAILISGHDLKDLSDLLYQTDGKGIDVYTHGEMLAGHGYRELKKYKHFYGHYGTAWQNQRKEFADFPGAILMTTNCIQRPTSAYMENIFTTGNVAFPGAVHVKNGDFRPVIQRAQELEGFIDTLDAGEVTVGFARDAVLAAAPQIVDAVKTGAIKHFFVVAGCDASKKERSYYPDLVEGTPQDTVVLTVACGKFRFFDKDLGDIGGIPRLLDVGQCNDAYSLVQIALALSEAFGVGVNELPLSIVLSWYEQKAVAILLTLLHLGIKDIRLGPSLPDFVSPNVLNVLVENFDIKPIGESAKADLAAMLGAKV